MNFLPAFPQAKLALYGGAAALLILAGVLPTRAYYKRQMLIAHDEALAQQAQAVQATLDTQQMYYDQMEGSLNEANAKLQQARLDVTLADDASRKLRTALTAYKSSHPAQAASSGSGEPNSDPIGVLADLLGRMDEAGGRISQYADQVKIAGETCEKAWPASK